MMASKTVPEFVSDLRLSSLPVEREHKMMFVGWCHEQMPSDLMHSSRHVASCFPCSGEKTRTVGRS